MSRINFITYSDLIGDIRSNIWKMPRDIDMVVGNPRSGMVPAYVIGNLLNLPVATLSEYLSGVIPMNGKRPIKNINRKHKKILIVDDCVGTGSDLQKVRKSIHDARFSDSYIFLAVYATASGMKFVDTFFKQCEIPRLFEWNFINHEILNRSCVDLDGVLCLDPTEEQNDDGQRYRDFISVAPPLYLPNCKIKAIVSSRLEKYRKETEKWLHDNNVSYDQLYLLDLPTKEERIRRNAHATHKSQIYSELKECELFIESSKAQAEEINKRTGKNVLCIENLKMYDESSVSDSSIVVLQMGKVGSTSLYKSLEKSGRKVHHCHYLSGHGLSRIESFYKGVCTPLCSDDFNACFKVLLENKELSHELRILGKRIKIISLIRDPVARNVSCFFQTADRTVGNFIEDYENGKLSIEEIMNAFMLKADHLRHLDWFKTELEDNFGFNIISSDFDKEKGYKIYNSKDADLLLIKYEKLGECVKDAIKEFVGIENFELQSMNISSTKPYHHIFSEFKKRFVPSAEYVSNMYDNDVVRTFYSEEEIKSFKKRYGY